MLSRDFLVSRGYCCGHGCLMCPYEPKHIKDNTILKVINCFKEDNPLIQKTLRRVVQWGIHTGVDIRWGGDWNRNGDITDNGFDDLFHFEVRL